MKKITHFLLAGLGLIMLASSCKKDDVADGGCSAAGGINVVLSTSRVEYNGFDYVSIVVKDDAGNDITSCCSILLNNTIAINSKYVPSGLGNYQITARIGTAQSTPKTLEVVPASASPFTTKAMIEDMTGAWCGYCPRVAYQLEQYKATHPNLIVVGIHGGGGTDPYKFQYYTTFNSKFGISGYPTAILNRRTPEWSEENSELDDALRAWAPVGISISSSTSGSNITGTVRVKYGVNSMKSMKLVIALVENGLVYPQVNYYSPQYGATPYLYGGVSPISNFVHNGVLRRTATDLFGDEIPLTQQTKDNIYEVPFSMPVTGNTSSGTYTANPANCAIVAYVLDGATATGSATNKGIYNAQYAPVGSTVNF
jgi:hypothetical protein